jgi:7-cyano-7-deazaguanine synthase in queuosine biosynthesis
MTTVIIRFDGSAQPTCDVLLRPKRNLITGESQFQDHFGNTTSLEEDLLSVASAVFAADLACKRGRCEQITRQISLTIPVVNHAAFQGLRDDICYALYVLSHDAWHLHFTPRAGFPEPTSRWSSTQNGKVLLFSGGLDSLAAAVRFAATDDYLQLVSHVTGNQVVARAQVELFDYLQVSFPGRLDRLAVRVGGRSHRDYPFPADNDREETERTRSFLFLALAAIAARRRGFRDVVLIAENGQMAIHLPLTAARISAFSTHTAHPEFVELAARIFSGLLSFEIRIENPFLYLTKAEVLTELVQSHGEIIPKTVSCWKASRLRGGKSHCGFCIPCLVRRIALESHGLNLDEYQRNMLVEDLPCVDADDDGKRNLCELGEFISTFETSRTQAEFEQLYPELLHSALDSEKTIAMYQRFADEARSVLDKYPTVASVLR